MLIAEACTIRFEPKTGENRSRNVTPLVRDDAVRGAGQEVLNGMCVVDLGSDPFANPRAFFFFGVTSSVEEFDSSMVSLQAC